MGIRNRGAWPESLPPNSSPLYAPDMLTITTKHLSIGEMEILKKPKAAFLYCSKLTLVKTKKEKPACFEMVKSWAINDDMEIETVDRSGK